MRNITVDIEQAKIEDLAVLINEITEDIKKSKGAALEDLDKKKTWRQKLQEFCDFSKGEQKVVFKDTFEDIKDTNVLLQLLTILSKKIYEEHNEVFIEVVKNLEELYSNIKDINDFTEELKKEVQEEIKKLKEFHTNKLNIRNRSNLTDENINLLLGTISFIYHLKEDHSKTEQEYLEAIKIFFNRGSYDIDDIDIYNNYIGKLEHEQAEIFYAFVLEAIAILYNEDNSNPASTTNSEINSYILDEIGLANSIKKKIESDINKELNDYSKIDIHFVKKYEKHIDNEDFLLDDFAFVIDENYIFVDIDDSNKQEDDDNNDETKKNTSTEQYEGIPLKVIEDLKACDSNICFETKDYFSVGKGNFKFFHSEIQDVISYNKSTKNYKTITSIPKDSAAALAHKSNLFIPGTDQLYVTDYENNILFYMHNNILHKINLESDSCIIFDNIELDDTIRSMQLYNNKIVMCSYDKLYLFDIEKTELQLITDSSEKSIGGTVSKATILNDIIYFYSSCGEKICADDGGSIKNSICAYDIKNKILKRIISISVDKLFTVYNDVYAIRNSDDYQGYELCKIIKNEDEYELMKIIEYSCPHTKITENYLLCYYDSEIHCENKNLFSIYAFDFRKQTFEKIVSDCYSFKDEGIIKPKWTKERSQFKVFGNWLYYYKDHIVWGFRSKDYTVRHIYRTNIHCPLRPVDIGEYNIY